MVNLNYLTDEPGLFGIFTRRELRAPRERGPRPAHLELPRGRRLLPHAVGLEAPDVEFHFAAAPFFDEGLTPPPDNGFAFGPWSSSRRRAARSACTPMPDSKPTVLCNFLTTDEDAASIVAGVRIALEIASQPALRRSASR